VSILGNERLPELVEHTVPSRTPTSRAWLMWSLGLAAYVMAVFHRASLGVAGLDAQERFHAGAAILSLFAVLQLAVYAAMQIPVGVVLDRLGTRRLVAAGALVMGVGQVTLGVAHSVPMAITARVLVGMGDAMTFISVLRLVAMWFPQKQAPVVTQLTGIIGQLGQVAAAYPLVALLHHAGWTSSYVGAGAVSVLVAVAAVATLRDAPPGVPARSEHPIRIDVVRTNLRNAWAEPGTRIGLWTHFVTQFSGTVFALLWGYPFLVRGEGVSPATAGALLSAMVFVSMLFGPAMGHLAGRWPRRRSALTFTIVGATASVWTAVLAWPGTAPFWLVVLLVVVLSSNGPGSMLGFDYARTFNPATRLGSASGIVNIGGFVASLSTMLAIGLVLAAAGGYSPDAFRLAFAVQYLPWTMGLWLVWRNRRLLRRRHSLAGHHLDPLHRAVVRRLTQAGGPRR
jgi:MFS family permease